METKNVAEASLQSRIKSDLTPILNRIQESKNNQWATAFFCLSPDELAALRDELNNPKLKLESPHDFWQCADMMQFLLHYHAWIFTEAVEPDEIDTPMSGADYKAFFELIGDIYFPGKGEKFHDVALKWYYKTNTIRVLKWIGKNFRFKHEERLRALDKAIELGNIDSIVEKGDLLDSANQNIAALKCYTTAMKLGNKIAQMRAGKILQKLADYDLAASCYIDMAITDTNAALALMNISEKTNSPMNELMFGVLAYPTGNYPANSAIEAKLIVGRTEIFREWARNRFEIQEMRDKLLLMPGGKEWLKARQRFEENKGSDKLKKDDIKSDDDEMPDLIDYSLIANICKQYKIEFPSVTVTSPPNDDDLD